MAKKILITNINRNYINTENVEIDAKTGKQYAIVPNPVPIGVCYVAGDLLDCYDWKDGEKLIILDLIEPDAEGIPIVQYYCHNEQRNVTGWVTGDQVRIKKC